VTFEDKLRALVRQHLIDHYECDETEADKVLEVLDVEHFEDEVGHALFEIRG